MLETVLKAVLKSKKKLLAIAIASAVVLAAVPALAQNGILSSVFKTGSSGRSVYAPTSVDTETVEAILGTDDDTATISPLPWLETDDDTDTPDADDQLDADEIETDDDSTTPEIDDQLEPEDDDTATVSPTAKKAEEEEEAEEDSNDLPSLSAPNGGKNSGPAKVETEADRRDDDDNEGKEDEED
ncbi:MAG: hypothetical protein M1548_01685 [Actinobacteria bacterium]|nr:hypothetical protein [Actinomycetota bacterium]